MPPAAWTAVPAERVLSAKLAFSYRTFKQKDCDKNLFVREESNKSQCRLSVESDAPVNIVDVMVSRESVRKTRGH